MTAINIIDSQTEVTIIPDTLARNLLGPDFHVSKTIAIPHMRIPVATRGPIGALDKVSRAVSSQAFDYASARAFLAERYATMNLNDAEIFVGGWDGDKGATSDQLKAIFGWITSQQADLYTRAARRKVLGEGRN